MRLASRLARTPEITEVLHDEAFQPCALNAMCLSETPYEALERFRRRCTLANRLQGCEHGSREQGWSLIVLAHAALPSKRAG